MTLTVEFEVHPEGNCTDCGAMSFGTCRAFGGWAVSPSPTGGINPHPVPECNTYRERESRKRHCRFCGTQDCNKPCDGADSKGAYVINCAEFTAPPRQEPSQC